VIRSLSDSLTLSADTVTKAAHIGNRTTRSKRLATMYCLLATISRSVGPLHTAISVLEYAISEVYLSTSTSTLTSMSISPIGVTLAVVLYIQLAGVCNMLPTTEMTSNLIGNEAALVHLRMARRLVSPNSVLSNLVSVAYASTKMAQEDYHVALGHFLHARYFLDCVDTTPHTSKTDVMDIDIKIATCFLHLARTHDARKHLRLAKKRLISWKYAQQSRQHGICVGGIKH
jgi:hypothetical protein